MEAEFSEIGMIDRETRQCLKFPLKYQGNSQYIIRGAWNGTEEGDLPPVPKPVVVPPKRPPPALFEELPKPVFCGG